MKFSPCIDACTYEGTHCDGCGRSHEEIAETKTKIMALVNYADEMDYENVEEFANYVKDKILSKLQ